MRATLRIRSLPIALAMLVGCGDDATGPAVPRGRSDAGAARNDAAVDPNVPAPGRRGGGRGIQVNRGLLDDGSGVAGAPSRAD